MQKQEEGLLSRCQGIVRDVILAFLGNEGLFLLMAFFDVAVLNSDIFGWYKEQVNAVYQFIVVPWGASLCLLRLQRRSVKPQRTHSDVMTLFILYMWLVVPFAIRFGMTFNNLSAWFGYSTMFFGVYASISEASKERRRNMLAMTSGLFAVFAVIWSGCLLYYAATAGCLDVGAGGSVFGVQDGYLWAGVHYNSTGMIALCLCMMSLLACSCAKNPLLKAVCVIPAAMSAAVVVLTQSRTSRYALLLALAIGAFDLLRRALAARGQGIATAAALLSAVIIIAGGYEVSKLATEAALEHYAARQEECEIQEPTEEVQTEDEPDAQIPIGAAVQIPAEPQMIEDISAGGTMSVRPGIDSTFSDRTTIWKNVLKFWREEPKMMLIGNGVGHTGSKIVEGTIHEESGAVAVHNTYLQWAADFGLIGFALEAVFLVIALRQALHAFLAKERERSALVLIMTAAAALAVGMMESTTLGAMTPINLVFMFSLAQLAGMSRESVSR